MPINFRFGFQPKEKPTDNDLNIRAVGSTQTDGEPAREFDYSKRIRNRKHEVTWREIANDRGLRFLLAVVLLALAALLVGLPLLLSIFWP